MFLTFVGVEPKALQRPEVAVNLWVYSDEGGYNSRIAGRAYVLDGDDDEKLAVLKKLAATDFLHAEWSQVPKQFSVVGHDGATLEGVAHTSMLKNDVTMAHAHLFGAVLESLAASVPEQMNSLNGKYQKFRLQMGEDPLSVTTVIVEREDGSLTPHVSAG